MTALLDTSVLIRYLTGDPPQQAERAAALIDSDTPLAVPVVALAETAYVLTTVYGLDRAAVVDALVGLLARANVRVHDLPGDDAVEALLLCRPSGRISFADALIWAATRGTSERQIFTFDQRFPTQDIDRQLLA